MKTSASKETLLSEASGLPMADLLLLRGLISRGEPHFTVREFSLAIGKTVKAVERLIEKGKVTYTLSNDRRRMIPASEIKKFTLPLRSLQNEITRRAI